MRGCTPKDAKAIDGWTSKSAVGQQAAVSTSSVVVAEKAPISEAAGTEGVDGEVAQEINNGDTPRRRILKELMVLDWIGVLDRDAWGRTAAAVVLQHYYPYTPIRSVFNFDAWGVPLGFGCLFQERHFHPVRLSVYYKIIGGQGRTVALGFLCGPLVLGLMGAMEQHPTFIFALQPLHREPLRPLRLWLVWAQGSEASLLFWQTVQ